MNVSKLIYICQKGFMEYEIELKLLTNEQAGEVIETKLLPQLNACVSQDTLVLTNQYFDTPERTLRQHRIGLRIRGNNQKFEQTLKTAGESIGGLHQRPEFNVDLDQVKKQNVKVPDLRLFPLSAWPETIDVDDLQTKIETLFTTHFERKIYLLEFLDGDIVELVWDLGEVKSGSKSTPICEVELELKKGNTAVLFNLAKRIVSLLPTSIGTDSKAALGYKLLDDSPVRELEQYQQNLTENRQHEAEVFATLLTSMLHDFQLFSAEIRRQYNNILANNINQVLSDLVKNVASFKHHFPCLSLDSIQIELKILLTDWSSVALQYDKNAAGNLLTRAQTTQLQLDIAQCLVEQPWSSID
jgi:triphosphatase